MKRNFPRLFFLLTFLMPYCSKENKVTSKPPASDTAVLLTQRPLMVEYWGGCCYDRNDVGPLDAIPDSVDVVNIFTLGIGKTTDGSWEFEHRGVSGYNDWNDVLTKAHALQKRGIRVVCTSFSGSMVNLTGAEAAKMAGIVKDSLDKWQLDGVDLDLEYSGATTKNIDSAVVALGKYLGPNSKTGRILSVVDYNNYNISQIKRTNKYIDYVMTMSYWNTSKQVLGIVKSYGAAIGDTKNVLIGVGQGCAINAGQATPAGEELKIADTLRIASPGSGMMEFVFGCSYHHTDASGHITKDISYTQNIIRHLKK
ncbi:EndoS/ChiA family endoglycosidase [Chitinophaga sancti]|uniref:mannosyl-glycoprotein endo-beta-N-acetylglucosaminidase n=1 Tax=Chitinophaga sancti TaxID=1004 RepID=A0A1K1RY45_9BACT|nr:glycosyl hydrolase family 18 protein [Chitinophaga sancti]WQD64107.1 glycosyl hydrolase family 18 protein [Chitinophaga sancti]WQG90269.1 glycosyl hydrolase family 18 protein [Chitinophaga sancti]SFW77064.1 Glycosyl hydrolases family 18 [Chitinophaga sancti]